LLGFARDKHVRIWRGGRHVAAPAGLKGTVPLIMKGTPPLRGVPYPTF